MERCDKVIGIIKEYLRSYGLGIARPINYPNILKLVDLVELIESKIKEHKRQKIRKEFHNVVIKAFENY